MGRLGTVLSFVRTIINGAQVGDVKTDLGGGRNVTGQNLAPAGDDSQPLPGDHVAIMAGSGFGQKFAVGYADKENAPVAGPGEKRIYARSAAGVTVCEIWLKTDGTIVVSNANGSIELTAAGYVDINGVIITTSGDLIVPGFVASPSVQAGGKELAGHVHLAGTPPGTTGSNV